MSRLNVPREIYDEIICLTDFQTAVTLQNEYAIANLYQKKKVTWRYSIREYDLNAIKWLYKKNGRDGFIFFDIGYAAEMGRLDVVKWLHEIQSDGFLYSTMDDAARGGELNVVKWLHENRTEGCTTKAMDYAAREGNLDVLKWLQKNRKEG